MADFVRAEAAEAPPEVLSYAFAPRLLTRGPPLNRAPNFALATYPWVSPHDGRTRHRIILALVSVTGSLPGVIVYEADPLDWSLEPVLFLNRDEMDRKGMLNDRRSIYPLQAAFDVKAVEVPDPVAEGEGRRGDTVILVATDKGNILALEGENLAFWGGVHRKHGYVRRLTPYYAYAEGGQGARRLRVVASHKGDFCVWDFTDALSGGWDRGEELGVLLHGVEMPEEADPSSTSAAYYETGDGGHRWGLRCV
jgi:hypothetical protein